MKNSALRRTFYVILSFILLLSLTAGNVLAADNQAGQETENLIEASALSLDEASEQKPEKSQVTDAQEVTTWQGLKAAIESASSTDPVGIILGNRIDNSTASSPIIINKNVTLDLNGKKITLAENTDGFKIESGATFTLKDGGTGGQIIGGKTAITILATCIFKMENGTISGSETGVDVAGSDSAGGIFKMFGGTISDNTTGVSTSSTSKFIMYSGSIINNETGVETPKYTSNVFEIGSGTDSGLFTGKIINNSDANVKLYKGEVIQINWSIDEESEIGITLLDNEEKPISGTFTGTIGPSLTVPLTVFSSDDSQFLISKNDSSYLQLVPKCTVTFDANGGSGEMGAQLIPEKAETALNANAFTKTGYSFDGWKDETGTAYTDQQKVSLTEDLALSAQWKPIPYTVLFVGDSGETLYQSSFNYGSKPEYRGKTPTKAEDEDDTYTWKGWMDTSSKEQYAKDQLPAVKGNTTYKAIFTASVLKANTYTVSFDMNGHGTAPAAQKVPENSRAKKPSSPTAQGYEFSGWYTEASCVNAYDFRTPVTGDITLYAKWTRNSSGGDSGGSGGRNVPNTLDSNRMMLWILLAAASLLAICGCIGIFRIHRAHH